MSALRLLGRIPTLSKLAVDHPWLTAFIWLVVAALGAYSFKNLEYGLLPDITFPVVVVDAAGDFASAVDTERSVTIPLEQRFAQLKTTDIRSTSYPGRSVTTLSFSAGSSLAARQQSVEDVLASVRIPGMTTYKVLPVNLNESAAVTYAVEPVGGGVVPSRTVGEIADELRTIPGVASVEVAGDGSRDSASRFNGRPGVSLRVVKRASANTLVVADKANDMMGRIKARYPQLLIVTAASQAPYIREASRATTDALIIAVGLSILVIFPFLRSWRATMIAALAIPMSLLTTTLVMRLANFDLETITLLALALIVGVIVDDAIVVIENITRHREDGEDARPAALRTIDEIGLTVTAATLTIVAVFLPIGVMGGELGQFFRPFGLTASTAVVASLLIALTLSPMLGAAWLRTMRRQGIVPAPPRYAVVYRRLLTWSLAHRRAVIAIAIGSVALGVALIPLIPKGFIPHLNRYEFVVSYVAPPNTSSSVSVQYAQQIEDALRKIPSVASTFTTIGTRGAPPNYGTITVGLKRPHAGTSFDVENEARRVIPPIPGVSVSVEDIPFVENGTTKPLQIAIAGSNLRLLHATAQKLKARLATLPGFVNVSADGAQTLFGLTVQIDRFNYKRVAYVSADLGPGLDIGDATDRAVQELRKIMPAGLSIELGGNSADQARTYQSFGIAMLSSVVCIFLVLFVLFRNWVAPVVIVTSLPLAVVGAMLALFFTRSDFGLISLMGLIFLFGLVNKNAILLVDFIQRLRRSGRTREQAIMEAGCLRLRPILMTTAATIFGMVPIALGIGAGAELRAPMAIAIIGGLVTSTLLTLVVIPVAYVTVEDMMNRPA